MLRCVQIPSSAVEMPGGADNSGSVFLDVQFGALEPDALHDTPPQSAHPAHPAHPAHSPRPARASLSSTHSVLAKSLMEGPRMTPEQLQRTDLIQQYMRRGERAGAAECPFGAPLQLQLDVDAPLNLSKKSPSPPRAFMPRMLEA